MSIYKEPWAHVLPHAVLASNLLGGKCHHHWGNGGSEKLSNLNKVVKLRSVVPDSWVLPPLTSCWEDKRKWKVNWNLQGTYHPADKVSGVFPIPTSTWMAFPSTGVQAGSAAESGKLGRNYNGSAMITSRFCFNHNTLIYQTIILEIPWSKFLLIGTVVFPHTARKEIGVKSSSLIFQELQQLFPSLDNIYPSHLWSQLSLEMKVSLSGTVIISQISMSFYEPSQLA